MKVAIVKPDHLGDFVLSSPAIRAIQCTFREVTLFISGPVRPLAALLFPDIESHTMDLAHLRKGRGEAVTVEMARNMLAGFNHVFFLRDDSVTRAIGDTLGVASTYAGGGLLSHETRIQQRALEPFVTYSRDEFFPGTPRGWPKSPGKLGLCISAGFPANRWPEFLWMSLGRKLLAQGWELSLVGGPNELVAARLLGRVLGISSRNILIGGPDIATFLEAIAGQDAVIATDGGTAHLCSLRAPVLSIFGASPWRRYAPFGSENRMVRREVPCSPCAQFSTETVNGCVTYECLTRISPDDVLLATDPTVPVHRVLPGGSDCWRGVSHLERR